MLSVSHVLFTVVDVTIGQEIVFAKMVSNHEFVVGGPIVIEDEGLACVSNLCALVHVVVDKRQLRRKGSGVRLGERRKMMSRWFEKHRVKIIETHRVERTTHMKNLCQGRRAPIA